MICGVDEAGRGPVIGPLVITGVKLENEKKIKEIGVKDSKKLTKLQRKMLAEKIKKIGEYYIEIINAKEIDELREKMTLNKIEVLGFIKVIKNLKPNKVYVDSVDINETRFKNEIKKNLDFDCEIISKHKADEIFPIVSSASILAKTIRDDEIKKIAREINFHFGSGYPSDPKTIDFLKKYVKENGKLPPHTRCSWQTAKKILDDYNKKFELKKLEQFMEV